MSNSEPTPLAQRLLSAAFEAEEEYSDSIEATPGATWDLGSIVRTRQRVAVVAVLRELADDNWFDSVIRNDLRALADSIEKGGDE